MSQLMQTFAALRETKDLLASLPKALKSPPSASMAQCRST